MPEEKLKQIDEILNEYAQIDGAHHKMWCIDQIARIVHGDHYPDFVRNYEDNYGDWDTGIAP